MGIDTTILFNALFGLIQPTHLMYLTIGTVLGLLVGILPGLGGVAGLSILLPFVFGMDESHALAMMIGLLAPTTTSDTFPSVLMGIPGTSGSQATVVDGFPLSKKGEGARALGAAFTASLFGGVFGALVLTGAVFAARPIILAMGFGEQIMLIILALSMVGMLTGDNALKGLATCGVGLIIGMIGVEPHGAFRLTFGSTYLSDGIPIVIVGLGMFALPEIIELLRRQQTIAEGGVLGRGWKQGFLDAIKHKWIVLRCSGIGCLIGALPGLGGSVVDWIAYGHIIQTSKDRSNFGKGDIRGVLAPESANNAKEGGALIPTLLFGIPGSGSMAILLAGFILIGIEPGTEMITTKLHLTYTIIWSLAIANVIGAGLCLVLAPHIAKLTTIRYALLAPFMIVLIFFAAFQSNRIWTDLFMLLGMGTLGVFMKRFGWSRPALLIGFFLSTRVETKLYQSVQVYGADFLLRPIVIVLLLLTIGSIYVAARFSPSRDKKYVEDSPNSTRRKNPQMIFTCIFILMALVVFFDGFRYGTLGKIFPIFIGGVTTLMLLGVLYQQYTAKAPSSILYDAELTIESDHSEWYYIGWILAYFAMMGLVGFAYGSMAFIAIFTAYKVGESVMRNALLGVGAVVFLMVMALFLTLEYPPGLLQTLVELPWWLGGLQ
ncbi:MAG: tripartite tricarboxylate transporter permease [Rhodospirillaceae bacterium]|jgi:putative tricarboxylic transport membrane protein